MLQRALSGLLDVLAPPRCAACTALLEARVTGFCDACAPLLERVHALADEHDCAACVYGGPLRDALHRLKYEGASELVPSLSALLVEPARCFLGRVDGVTAVPLHPRRLRARGYNQSVLLAVPLARQLGVPLWPRLLTRTRDTSAQVGKGRGERSAQLQGSFVAAPRARGRRILVVDDVRTTGATFAEARRALREAGATDVLTIALAETPGCDEP